MPDNSPEKLSEEKPAPVVSPLSKQQKGENPAPEATNEPSLSNEEFEAKVAEVIKIIRPAVQADQGDIFLRSVEVSTGEVNVELVGACVTCPASTQTLKEGLERILKQRVEGVTSVQHVGAELLGAEEGVSVSL